MSGAAGTPEASRPFDAPEAPVLRCPSCGAPAAEKDEACAYCGSLLATRRCAACFALSPRDALRCVRCGAALPGESLNAVGAGLPCPDCRVPLVARTTGTIAYSECARCGGLFLNPQAFEAIASDADARAGARAVEGGVESRPSLTPRFHYRPCPVCRALMNRTNYAGGSGIILDVCRRDGVWCDRGELTGIVDFLEKGGWDRVRRREKQKLEEEVSALEARKRASETPGLAMPAGSPMGATSDLLSWLGSVLVRR